MQIRKHIKKGFAGSLLVIYMFGILKPLSPIVSDLISHTFDKANHMATVHFENGKYHVHKEIIADTENNSEQKKTSANFLNEDLLSNHLQPYLINLSPPTYETLLIHTESIIRFADIFFKTYTPPPEA